MSGGFRIEPADGLVLVRCGALEAVPGVAHAFSTRRADGLDAFDLGAAGAEDPETIGRRGRFLRAAGLAGEAAVLRQVHGARVVRVTEDAGVPEGDAVVWLSDDPTRRVPSVRTADCVPVLLADRDGSAAAAIHAGWRGIAAGVARETVLALGRLGVAAPRLVAALGPAILPCCYEVGPEVAAALARASGGAESVVVRGAGDRIRLDLQAANRAQLEAAGVPREAIHVGRLCTRCRGDLFFSHRRDGSGTGRMMASVGPSRTRLSGRGQPFRNSPMK